MGSRGEFRRYFMGFDFMGAHAQSLFLFSGDTATGSDSPLF
jgi:hypothetical protein